MQASLSAQIDQCWEAQQISCDDIREINDLAVQLTSSTRKIADLMQQAQQHVQHEQWTEATSEITSVAKSLGLGTQPAGSNIGLFGGFLKQLRDTASRISAHYVSVLATSSLISHVGTRATPLSVVAAADAVSSLVSLAPLQPEVLDSASVAVEGVPLALSSLSVFSVICAAWLNEVNRRVMLRLTAVRDYGAVGLGSVAGSLVGDGPLPELSAVATVTRLALVSTARLVTTIPAGDPDDPTSPGAILQRWKEGFAATFDHLVEALSPDIDETVTVVTPALARRVIAAYQGFLEVGIELPVTREWFVSHNIDVPVR